jgi:hypothetical protein
MNEWMEKIGIVILLLLLIISTVKADVLTKYPTAYANCQWTSPTNAYSSDNAYASASPPDGSTYYCTYYNFGFDLPSNAVVSSVELGSEWYLTNPTYEDYSHGISCTNGSSSTSWELADRTTEGTDWTNATSQSCTSGWNYLTLRNGNLSVKVSGIYSTGGGCYADNMYFVSTTNQTCLNLTNAQLLNITNWDFLTSPQILDDIKNNISDYLLVWNEDTKSFSCRKAIAVDVHLGNWTMLDIYSGKITFNYTNSTTKKKESLNWSSHVELTDNHKVWYSLDNKTFVLGNASEVYQHFMNNKTVYINHLWMNYTLNPFPVTQINIRQYEGYVYDVKVEGATNTTFKIGKTLNSTEKSILDILKSMKVPVGKFPPFLAISQKTTFYLDSVAVRVTYTIPSAGGQKPALEETDPLYCSIPSLIPLTNIQILCMPKSNVTGQPLTGASVTCGAYSQTWGVIQTSSTATEQSNGVYNWTLFSSNLANGNCYIINCSTAISGTTNTFGGTLCVLPAYTTSCASQSNIINSTTVILGNMSSNFTTLNSSISSNFTNTNNLITSLNNNMGNNFTTLNNNLSSNFSTLNNNLNSNFTILNNNMNSNFSVLNNNLNNNFSTLNDNLYSNFTNTNNLIIYLNNNMSSNFTYLNGRIALVLDNITLVLGNETEVKNLINSLANITAEEIWEYTPRNCSLYTPPSTPSTSPTIGGGGPSITPQEAPQVAPQPTPQPVGFDLATLLIFPTAALIILLGVATVRKISSYESAQKTVSQILNVLLLLILIIALITAIYFIFLV